MKIAILGLTGSGKSTLARQLAKASRLPLLHLDTVQFLPGWHNRPINDQHAMVRAFLDDHQSWVIDGNYTNLYYRERLDDADLIVVMLFNRFARLHRTLRRLRAYRGQSRPSMTAGCEERMNADFVWWILHRGCDAKHMLEYRTVTERYAGKTVVLRNQRQLDRFTASQIQPR
ncbi:DNA topology modulation protein FlaR [Bifidobacterium avesanii]|uniref:DNA topology modulation protein FlaR n=1 Tax=Bifidobacterium avesanii TaxID=1798157 RepID=A0A7K3TJT7_9BIFI|nr:DNA topology modulation protein FlaR [Bifidobacterium avesanii]KAB8286603.1 adenylate kinase [Bifidobacterium avesanii]NEG79387.1 DNA topology modulation protein FlaR [Bifidobacterium avesanii]